MTGRFMVLVVTAALLLGQPAPARGQQVSRLRAGASQIQPIDRLIRRDALEVKRRGNWEIGAALGGIAGAACGYALVVFHNDGLAEKWGVAPTAATIIGSAALGAGIGALLQMLVSGG